MQLTPSFRVLLPNFRPVFTAPAFRLFVLILTGWALSCRHRFITECIFTAGQVGIGHWSCFHRFFSHYAWSLDDLCQASARCSIERFAAGRPHSAGCRRHPVPQTRPAACSVPACTTIPCFPAKPLKVFSWGHDWVVLALLVRLPRWAPTKVFALPLLFRLYVNRQGVAKGKKAKQERHRRSGAAGRQKKKWRRPPGATTAPGPNCWWKC